MGENYADLLYCHTIDQFKANDKRAQEIVDNQNLEEYADILDFLYASDAGGSISYKTCKRIYDLMKDQKYDGIGFRYAAYRHNDYEEFKEFLLECYSHRRKLRWY